MRGSRLSFANASWRSRATALAVLALAATAACKRASEPEPAIAASSGDETGGTAEAAAGNDGGAPSDGAVADAHDVEADKLAGFLTGEPKDGKSVGHTSLVFRLTLDNGLEAAYKPRSRKALGTYRYKGEIAAYRLSRALGLRNVPVALPRTFTAAKVRSILKGRDVDAWDREAFPGTDGKVEGAILPWIKLVIWDIEFGQDFNRWREWLMVPHSDIPLTTTLGNDHPLKVPGKLVAGQLDTMVVFDYLTANWDRWSGGNVGYDTTTDTVLYVDNDGAFYEAPDQQSLIIQLDAITKFHRFSRSFVEKLRSLDAKKIEDAIGEEAPGTPLLTPKVLAGIEERRKKVLGVIDAKIAADGADSVLYFE